MARTKVERRQKRKMRVRKKVEGVPERPRLSVQRTNKHFYAQIIDDMVGKTIVSVSSLAKELKSIKIKGNKDGAAKVGALVAKMAQEKGVKKVVFDRSGFIYHGCIKALADAAREKGLVF